jgi:hypothetical protein
MPWGENTNSFGDVIEKGRMIKTSKKKLVLNGEGVAYRKHKEQYFWIKSPDFRSGEVHGLFVRFDKNKDLIFYGLSINNQETESREYHSFLHDEYQTICGEEFRQNIVVDYLYSTDRVLYALDSIHSSRAYQPDDLKYREYESTEFW